MKQLFLMSQMKPDWKKLLSPQQYNVLRNKETEPAFSGKYWNEKVNGKYVCAACGNVLFDSKTKFDSGTGWPSFFDCYSNEAIELIPDKSDGMNRVEVTCRKCGGHLGHLFNDGPKPTGKRYCINSLALDLKI